MKPRYKYNEFSRYIKDTQTGYIYNSLQDITLLLNQITEEKRKYEKEKVTRE